MKTQTVTVDTNHATVQRLFGFLFADDTGAVASVNLRAGSVSGQIVVGPIEIASGGHKMEVLSKAVFWEFPGGCFVEEVSGSVEGVLWF